MMTGFKLGLSGKAEAHSSNEGEGHRPNQNTTSARTRATENFVSFRGNGCLQAVHYAISCNR